MLVCALKLEPCWAVSELSFFSSCFQQLLLFAIVLYVAVSFVRPLAVKSCIVYTCLLAVLCKLSPVCSLLFAVFYVCASFRLFLWYCSSCVAVLGSTALSESC